MVFNQPYNGNVGVSIRPTNEERDSFIGNKTIRILKDFGAMPWPYPDAASTILSTRSWPQPFALMHYSLGSLMDFSILDDRRTLDDKVISCTTLYSFLTKNRYNNYWSDMNVLLERARSRYFRVHETAFGDIKTFTDKDLDSKARAALGYFGKEYWPDDFVVISFAANAFPGAISRASVGCDETSRIVPTLQFIAEPRRLYLLVAEIEPIADRVDIEQIGYMRDSCVEC